MQFVDTHLHINDFNMPAQDVVQEAKSAGVFKIIAVSSQKADWQKNVNVYKNNLDNIIPAVGIHPWFVSNHNLEDLENLERFLSENDSLLIGECGLDSLKEEKQKQIDFFVRQADLSRKYKRAMIIHCVKEQQWFQNNWNLLPEKYVIHSYSEKFEFLKQILNHNGFIGINSLIFRSSDAEKIIKYIPKERILIETDAPYQAFNKENFTKTLKTVFYKLAEIRKEDKEIFANQIFANSMDFIK